MYSISTRLALLLLGVVILSTLVTTFAFISLEPVESEPVITSEPAPDNAKVSINFGSSEQRTVAASGDVSIKITR